MQSYHLRCHGDGDEQICITDIVSIFVVGYSWESPPPAAAAAVAAPVPLAARGWQAHARPYSKNLSLAMLPKSGNARPYSKILSLAMLLKSGNACPSPCCERVPTPSPSPSPWRSTRRRKPPAELLSGRPTRKTLSSGTDSSCLNLLQRSPHIRACNRQRR